MTIPLKDSMLSRRKLLAVLGTAGAAIATGAIWNQQTAQAVPDKKDKQDKDHPKFALLGSGGSSVMDYGAVGDGTTDDTTAIQDALDATVTGEVLYFPAGTYLISAQLTCQNKTIHLVAEGNASLKEASVLGVPMLLLTNVSHSVIDGLGGVGAETYAGFAGTSTLDNTFLRVNNSTNVTISNCVVSNKSYGFVLSASYSCKVLSCHVTGFLNVPKTGANYCSCCRLLGGKGHNIIGLYGKDMGSGVSIGSDGYEHVITDCHFQNMQDNGVYISSGGDITVNNVIVIGTEGSGVKARGSRNIVSNCIVKNCIVGYSLTGNGVTADTYGANGYGTILQGCIAENCEADGINIGIQDGYYSRHFKVVNNVIINCATSGGGYAGVRCGGGSFHEVRGNTFHISGGSYAILMVGNATKSAVGFQITDNLIMDAKEGIRLQYLNRAIISKNWFEDIDTIGIQLRFCTNCTVSDNDGQQIVACKATYSNTSNIIHNNRGTSLDVDLNTNQVRDNTPSSSNVTNSIAAIPVYIGQIAVVSGQMYMASGTTATSDWKLLA